MINPKSLHKGKEKRLAHSTISRSKAAARIEEVVGDFVPLKKQGSLLVGLCPFHTDRTPSFKVSPVKGIAKCFSCGQSFSSSVNFLMEKEQMTYVAAIEYLAKKYGIPIEYEYDDEASVAARQAAKAEEAQRHALMDVSKRAETFFASTLYLPAHREALEYVQSRGISIETMQLYAVGYATRADQGMGVVRAALKSDLPPELLINAGLAFSAHKARFINRIMFPIRRGDGRTVGFGGRILPSEPDAKAKQIKYLNTCETAVYKKHALLFGLDIALKDLHKQGAAAYICEGYMDVLALYEGGIRGAVAACGTAFTQEQAQLVAHRFKKAVLCYDGDDAGANACVSTMKVLLVAGVIPEIFMPPKGDDPASLLLSLGQPSDLPGYIAEHTVSYLEYLVGDCTVASASPGIYQEVMTRTAEVVACVQDAVLREQAIAWVAHRVGASVEVVAGMVAAHTRIDSRVGMGDSTDAGGCSTAGAQIESVVPCPFPFPSPREALEQSIVSLLKEYPCRDFLDFAREEIVEDGLSFTTVNIQEVLDGIAVDAALFSEELDEPSNMLPNLVVELKQCAVLERMEKGEGSWKMLGELKRRMEEL